MNDNFDKYRRLINSSKDDKFLHLKVNLDFADKVKEIVTSLITFHSIYINFRLGVHIYIIDYDESILSKIQKYYSDAYYEHNYIVIPFKKLNKK